MGIRRISLGPGEVAGYFSGLKAGFEELGIECEHFGLQSNEFAYPQSHYFLRAPHQTAARWKQHRSLLVRSIGRIAAFLIRCAIFLYALLRCDVFIFSGFFSFFEFRELQLLKLLGKRVVVVYLGSDARPPIFSGRHLDDLGGQTDVGAILAESERMLKRIRRVEMHADVIVNHTATAQFFTRSFVRLFAVGMPFRASPEECVDSTIESKPLRILHAPSRPIAKGSLAIRELVLDLQAQGYPIEFVELVGVPNSQVLQELQRCDFVIDELYSDTPMAMLATEAAVFCKPVVVGGYYSDLVGIDNADPWLPPSLYVDPKNMRSAVLQLIADPQLRLQLGRSARAFVDKNWGSRRVATNFLRLIEGDIPIAWTCAPSGLEYIWGWGLSKDHWQIQVSNYVFLLGSDALLLNHNASLKLQVLNHIGLTSGGHAT